MLISHRHKFIFIKSSKTAGTSTEVFFEQFCVPPSDLPKHWDDWDDWHGKAEYQISEYGVVTARGPDTDKSNFFNHMTPNQLVLITGKELWDEYFTFVNVRNPWDKTVSRFFHSPPWNDIKNDDPAKSVVRDAFNTFVFSNTIKQMSSWVLSESLPFDDFIRHENLESDIGRIMRHLNLRCERELPRLKTDMRSPAWPDYRALYGSEAKNRVAEQYSGWIERFSYAF